MNPVLPLNDTYELQHALESTSFSQLFKELEVSAEDVDGLTAMRELDSERRLSACSSVPRKEPVDERFVQNLSSYCKKLRVAITVPAKVS